MEFLNEFKANASSGNYYYFFYIVILITLIFLLKGRRVRFVIPSLVISIVIFNPILYKYWVKLDMYAYWRILWIIPVIPVCASFPAMVAEKIKNKKIKTVIGIMCTLVFLLLGSYIYNSSQGKFDIIADNSYKLPDSSINVAEILLEYDSSPKVVAVPNVSIYIRQYSGKIDTYYGRDVYGYINESNTYAKIVNDAIMSENGDMDFVAKTMLNEGYDFLVIPNPSKEKETLIENAGFIWLNNASGYSIYKVQGVPTIKKIRNDLGQVVSETTLDVIGTPTDEINGYSTTEYKYDKYGNISWEFHLCTDGMPYVNENGISGYNREFDRYGRIIKETYIGSDGKPVNNKMTGHAETRYSFNKEFLVKESYYNQDEKPVIREDLLYSSHSIVRDDNGLAISESYYDDKGNPTLCGNGYSTIKRKYDDNGKIVEERFYGQNGLLINIPLGYSIVNKEYDEFGNVIKESFFGEDELPICCIKGYSTVTREYNDSNKIVKEFYYDEDGNPDIMLAGYSGISQKYDTEGNLIERDYLNQSKEITERSDGYAKVIWEKDSETGAYNVFFYDIDGNIINSDGINLIKDIPDGWSEWITPEKNISESSVIIGNANLGEKNEGDSYTCQVEIEFKGVSATDGKQFVFRTEGPVDGAWDVNNVWNAGLVYLADVPKDGVYTYTNTYKIELNNVNSSFFSIGFRCDNWKSGSFRVRNVKIEKGDSVGDWSPGM